MSVHQLDFNFALQVSMVLFGNDPHGIWFSLCAVRQHFLNRMPEKLAKECEGDDQDLAEADAEEEAASAMGGLKMEDGPDEDAEEAAVTTETKKKKKKKKKTTLLGGQL